MPSKAVDFDKQLKNKLLEMFKWFHGFCVENSLRYFALGGTMLGAVRHNAYLTCTKSYTLNACSAVLFMNERQG